MSKITTFLSDMQEFFNGNSEHAATQSICNAVAGVRMSERHTLGVESRPNQVYRLLDVFQCLLMCPFFLVKNVSALSASPLHGLMEAGKDVFYRFMERADIDWRKALWHITLQLWNRICVRSEHSLDETCLIVDDTDLGKTGRRIERISRIHSHLQHKAVLGFKMLALVVTDGFSQMLLDFALLGEKGKKGKYGMSDKELSRRRQPKRAQTACHGQRETEYDKSKIELVIEMVKRAISKRVRFSYLLADSWFACKELIRFIHTRRVKCHFLGMIKVGEHGRTKYDVGGIGLTAAAMVKQGKERMKYSRRHRCHYMVYDACFAGVPVRIFLVRRTRHGQWNGLMTTNTRLGFLDAWRIYSKRWTIEVVFKDCKQHLMLGKCQSTNFATQIAATSICAIQYNLLSLAKRFMDYETVGGLFREISKETVRQSIAQQLWGKVQEMLTAIAEVCGLVDEDLYEIIINKTEQVENMFAAFNLKQAS